jgi:hypothetical protein
LKDWIDEQGGVSGILLESLHACNHDIRARAAQNLIFIGEGADLAGTFFVNGFDSTSPSFLFLNMLHVLVNELQASKSLYAKKLPMQLCQMSVIKILSKVFMDKS